MSQSTSKPISILEDKEIINGCICQRLLLQSATVASLENRVLTAAVIPVIPPPLLRSALLMHPDRDVQNSHCSSRTPAVIPQRHLLRHISLTRLQYPTRYKRKCISQPHLHQQHSTVGSKDRIHKIHEIHTGEIFLIFISSPSRRKKSNTE